MELKTQILGFCLFAAAWAQAIDLPGFFFDQGGESILIRSSNRCVVVYPGGKSVTWTRTASGWSSGTTRYFANTDGSFSGEGKRYTPAPHGWSVAGKGGSIYTGPAGVRAGSNVYRRVAAGYRREP